MTTVAGARRVATLALVVGLLAACQPTTVVIQRPPIPDQPDRPDLLGQAVVVGEGSDATLGDFRAWIYRTGNGEICFEVATVGMSTSGCSPVGEHAIGIGSYETDGGWFVAGGTALPAVRAVVQLVDGSLVEGPVAAAPPGVTDGISYVVIPVSGAAPQSVALAGADGSLLDSVALNP